MIKQCYEEDWYNLGPNRLAGPKALDPDQSRKPTLWLHDHFLKVLIVHGIDLRLCGAKTFTLLILLMSHIWRSSSKYNFKRLRHRNYHLPVAQLMRYKLCLVRRNGVIKNHPNANIYFVKNILHNVKKDTKAKFKL